MANSISQVYLAAVIPHTYITTSTGSPTPPYTYESKYLQPLRLNDYEKKKRKKKLPTQTSCFILSSGWSEDRNFELERRSKIYIYKFPNCYGSPRTHRIPNNPGNGNTLGINLIYVRFVCFNVQYSLISFKKPRRQESPEVGEGFLPSALLRQCWLSASDFGSAGQRSLFTLSLLLLQEYTHASIFLITILNKLNRSVFLLSIFFFSFFFRRGSVSSYHSIVIGDSRRSSFFCDAVILCLQIVFFFLFLF